VANRRERRAARAGKGRDQRPAGSNAALVAARRLYESGRFVEAERFCEQYLRKAPRDALALYLLGMAAIGTGRLALAETSFAEALAQRPTEPAFHNGMALLRGAQQRFAEALTNHDRALAFAPDDLAALLGRAQALVELDELAEAERSLHRASILAPRSPEIWQNLAAVRAERGLVTEAAAAYETLVVLDPESAEAKFGHATVLARLGRLAPAVDACDRALALDPALPGVRPLLVDLLCDLGRPQEALACGLDGLKRLPSLRDSCLAFVSALARNELAAHDPEVELATERCFGSPDIDCDDLAKPAALQIRIAHGIDAEPRQAGGAAVDRLLSEDALPPVLGDRLLRLLLAKVVNRDRVLEAFLTAARSRICLAPAVPTAANPFLAALALQAFNNGYVFALSVEEERQVVALKTALEAELQVGFEPSPQRETRLLRYALYAPLFTLAGASRLAEAPDQLWSEDFRSVLERTLREPLEERALSATMPSLSTIGDPISLKVGAQYQEHPYPRWFTLPRPVPERLVSALRRKFPHAMLPRYLDDKIEILIAGAGTGLQPLTTALSLRNVEVLAVDLSRASLAYAQRMAIKLEVANIRFLQADLLRLGDLGRQFPVIEVVGVLHHLQAPMAGWRVLTSLLRPGGLMRVGLYSALARAEIAAARERIATLGLKPIPADIRRFRDRVLFESEAIEFPRLALSKDIYDLNGCRDLLFHACEHRFTLPEIQGMLTKLGLEFLGFEDLAATVARHYHVAYPQDPAMTDLANWARFEEAQRDAFPMYVFWCAKCQPE
jgi:tetratricopeptide (TPR) repeat protein